MHAERAFVVVRVVRSQRADDAQVVGHVADVREQVADLGAARAAGRELPVRPLENSG